VAALLVLVAAIGLSGCLGLGDDSDEADGPGVAVEMAGRQGSEAMRIEAVPRSPRGLGQDPPSERELALADRIMAANAFLARIAEDAGGYEVAEVGLIQAAGPDRILGLVVDLRLERPVDGIYELPLTCHGISGPPFALPPTPFNLDDVPGLIVEVSFADRRVASIDALGGRARAEPGAAYLSAPSACEARALRDRGY
jgi:hypothetical protein